MLLTIDAGNTNVVFALVEDGLIRERWRIGTDARRTGDEYAVWLLQLLTLSGYDRSVVGSVIIATVVPKALDNLMTLSRKYFGHEPLVIGEDGVDLGLTVDVENPSEVGADRVVNALAAHHAYGGDLIVVDFGTATTFDIVDFSGAYKGGIIAPGINLSIDALAAAAARLPRIVVEAPEPGRSIIGRNTLDAMHSGIYWGYVSLIEGLIARVKTEIGRPVKVVATGGLALLFEQHIAAFDHVESDLTIKGLAIIHQRNMKN